MARGLAARRGARAAGRHRRWPAPVALCLAATLACGEPELCALDADGQPFALAPALGVSAEFAAAAAAAAAGPEAPPSGRGAPGLEGAPCPPQDGNDGVPLVRAERMLEVPGLPADAVAFNPGMARWRGRDVVAFRVEVRAPGAPLENLVAVGTLDANHRLDGPVTILDIPHPPGRPPSAEDPRLVVHRGALHLVYNRANTARLMGPRSLHLAWLEVDGGAGRWTYRLAKHKQLLYAGPDGRLPQISKNWSPFVAGGELHFIFSSSPLQVLRVDNTDLDDDQPELWCEALPANPQPVPWRYGPPRGGSQAIYEPLLQRFITFFHSRRRCRAGERGEELTHQYLTGAYTFTPEAPFTVDRVLPHPLMTASFLSDLERPGPTISFVSGLVLEPDRIKLTFGRNDDSAGMLVVDKQRLFQQWAPANEGR